MSGTGWAVGSKSFIIGVPTDEFCNLGGIHLETYLQNIQLAVDISEHLVELYYFSR